MMTTLALTFVSLGVSFTTGSDAVGSGTFDYNNGLVFVRGQVNGSNGALCLLDTGANVSAIDTELAEKLGLEAIRNTEVVGTAGSVPAVLVGLESLEILGARVGPLEITRRDIHHGATPGGTRLGMIVGYDFLKHFAATIDFRRQRIALLDEPPRCDTWVPMDCGEGIPKLNVTLHGKVKSALRMDTGASLFATDDVYINITEGNWKEIQGVDPGLHPKGTLTASGVGGELRLQVVPLAALELDSLRIEKPFAIVQPRQGYFARPDAVGFFGNNLLEKFDPITLDYRSNRLGLHCAKP